jgi:hypothetical protein
MKLAGCLLDSVPPRCSNWVAVSALQFFYRIKNLGKLDFESVIWRLCDPPSASLVIHSTPAIPLPTPFHL